MATNEKTTKTPRPVSISRCRGWRSFGRGYTHAYEAGCGIAAGIVFARSTSDPLDWDFEKQRGKWKVQNAAGTVPDCCNHIVCKERKSESRKKRHCKVY